MMRPIGARHDGEVRPGPLVGLVTCRGNRVAVAPRNTHMGHFLESIRTRKPFWEDAVAGHHAAACAHLINLSAKQKRLVEWDFGKDDIRLAS